MDCELCASTENLIDHQVALTNQTIKICAKCDSLLNSPAADANHWRCLNNAIWSEQDAVKILSYRILSALPSEGWAQELLEQIYLDDVAIETAKKGLPEAEEIDSSAPTLDSNGTRLQEGDSVTLIKDLDVKGAGFTAKRGTLVKNITLTSNPKHIEGRVNGIQIVLVAAYLKKA